MNRLKPLFQVTLELEEILSRDISAKNREAIIVDVNRLIEKRGDLLQELTPPFTDEENQIGEKLVTMNNTIQENMTSLFADLKQEMKQVKKQKRSNKTYTNPYKNVQTIDGMFMDKKE
ncbi:flagellar protein FliT [Lentibacillus sp. Marseille-P4043]|uniref:flagellar protein FliT n=1 Tax=Lentibacillus sp. Marseille-P4043 TaxID=2040293 RepID=UPI000D0B9D26|nr:flagellar protein FliT [Lentibacillus sp. Marseille-P4043]